MRSPRSARARRLALAAFAALTTSLAAVTPARANGRFPAANQLVLAPSDANTLLLRTTFGLLLSRDHGARWDWICERAVGYGGQPEDPAIGITAAGNFLVGTFEGLAISYDKGCGWKFGAGIPAGSVIVDLVVRPDAPRTALALASKPTGTSDAGDPTYTSQIYESTDDGVNWAPHGPPIDSSVALETIEVAASDVQRVYLSGTRGVTSPAGVLLVSTDDAATFDERAVPLVAGEKAPFVAAVDPTNADVVYLRTQAPSASRLLVTKDAGKSFVAPYSGGVMLGFALSPDGSRVYVGGATDGLHIANTTDLVFTQTSKVQVQCLRAVGGSIFVCSSELNGFVLGESTNDGATFTPLLHLQGIRGPLSCAAGTSTAVCIDDWSALARQLGIDNVADDAGVADAGAIADASIDATVDAGAMTADAGAPAQEAPAPASSSGCGCAVVGASARRSAGARTEGEGPRTGGAAALLVAAALGLRRRRQRFAMR